MMGDLRVAHYLSKRNKIMAIKKEYEKIYKKQYEKDHKMVRGKFSFLEVPGGELRFTFLKYDGDPLLRYKWRDGDIVEVPYMVAKHIAQDVKVPVHDFQTDEFGKKIPAIAKWTHRTAFQRLDFEEDEEFTPATKNITIEAAV